MSPLRRPICVRHAGWRGWRGWRVRFADDAVGYQLGRHQVQAITTAGKRSWPRGGVQLRMPVGTVVTVTEAARALRCGRTRVFELLASGHLGRGVRFGRETVVTVASIEALQTVQAHHPAPRRRRPKRCGRLRTRSALCRSRIVRVDQPDR